MDPLKTVRTSAPKSIRRRLAKTPLKWTYDTLRSSAFYTDARMRLTEINRVSFDTELGEFSMLIPETASGLVVEKTSQPGGYEPGLVETLADVLSEDDTIFDVGAGFGYNGALARAAGVDQLRIHLFEANSFRAELCRRNHPRANVTNCFVADGDIGNLALDPYVRREEPPTVALVDVEGAELDALRGMCRTLSKFRPALLVELHPELLANEGQSVGDVYEYLREFDYELSVTNHRVRDGEWTNDVENPDVSTEAYTPTYLLKAA